MSRTAKIKLLNIPETMQPGDAITCTVDDAPHNAEFVRYGSSKRFIFVKIYGLQEIRSGTFIAPPMFPDSFSYTTEFIVNDNPIAPWHRTAGACVRIDE